MPARAIARELTARGIPLPKVAVVFYDRYPCTASSEGRPVRGRYTLPAARLWSIAGVIPVAQVRPSTNVKKMPHQNKS